MRIPEDDSSAWKHVGVLTTKQFTCFHDAVMKRGCQSCFLPVRMITALDQWYNKDRRVDCVFHS